VNADAVVRGTALSCCAAVTKTSSAAQLHAASAVHVERLPAYAPELNPIEQVWGNMKSTELANQCPDTLDEVRVATESGPTRIGSSYDLCHSFLDHTGLS